MTKKIVSVLFIQTAAVLWDNAVKPITDLFFADRWAEAVEKWYDYSIERYLTDEAYLSPDAIQFIAVMMNFETSLYSSILDNVLTHLVVNDQTEILSYQRWKFSFY